MKDLPLVPERTPRRGNLEGAPRIAGCDKVRRHRRDVSGLPQPECRSRFGLDEIVDARAAAADLAFGRRQELDAWNLLEQRAGLRTNPLPVSEVTRIVIHDARVNRVARRA